MFVSNSNPVYVSRSEEGVLKRKPSSPIAALHKTGWYCLLGIPYILNFFELKFTTYYLTTQRLRIQEGIFTRYTHEIELFRVRDMEIKEPLLYRLFSLGNIIIYSEDKTEPIIVLEAIYDASFVYETIRNWVFRYRGDVPPLWH